MGHNTIWVLQDPMTRELRYVNEAEFDLLALVDGQRTVQQILQEYSKRFADRLVSNESLVDFLSDAKRKRLLTQVNNMSSLSLGSLTVEDASKKRRRSPLLRLMAFRVPGVQPDRFLASIDPLLRLFLSPWVIAVYALVLLTAIMIAAANWGGITSDVGFAIANRGTQTATQLLMVVLAVKVIHELAHTTACYLFAGSCRELGVMFLLGIPCLYCDVSNAWLVPNRWKRVLISAAGMIAELGIAAVATVLWIGSADASLREWCLVIMVVCSVSTVVVNANPLMRFDGYFIFSDLIAIPNLALRAKLALQQVVRRFLWNEPYPTSSEVEDTQRHWLAAYSCLSMAYRASVMIAIGLLVYRFGSGHGLAVGGLMLAIALATATLWPEVRFAIASTNPSIGTYFSRPGWSMRLLCLIVLGIALTYPFPQSVVSPMTIRSLGSQEVFAPVSGRLVSSVEHGQVVSTGEPIVTLENWGLRSQLTDVESRYQSFVAQEDSLISHRVSGGEVSAQMLTAATSAQAAKEKATLLQEEVNKLTVTSPRAGMVFPGQARRDQASLPNDLQTWTRFPIDPANRGAWIEAGSLLCVIGDPVGREAILLVHQNEIQRIRSGQPVDLLIPSVSGDRWQGEVIEVGAVPVSECPPELAASGMVMVNATSATNRPKPQETLYQVRVKIIASEGVMPSGTIGHASVSVGSASIASRAWRAFSQSFRW
jgi:putative peptide zinc metalloprotease protein